MSGTGERSKSRLGGIVTGVVATVMVAGACVGGIAVANGVAQANQAHAIYVASDHQLSQEMVKSAAADQQVQAEAVQTQHINDVNAQVQAAEDAKAAAAAAALAAQQAAAQAAAQQQAEQQAAARQQTADSTPASGSSGGSSSSGEPSGTPLPMAQVTDPNNGQYGQMVPTVDPASWCANHSASTINGVPTCD
jgi:hypothetical protein